MCVVLQSPLPTFGGLTLGKTEMNVPTIIHTKFIQCTVKRELNFRFLLLTILPDTIYRLGL